jgi:hypothetical protein
LGPHVDDPLFQVLAHTIGVIQRRHLLLCYLWSYDDNDGDDNDDDGDDGDGDDCGVGDDDDGDNDDD